MAGIYGVLGLDDNDVTYLNTLGQERVFEVANDYLRLTVEELDEQRAAFIERTTENYKTRYKLPGGGRMQRRGGHAESAAAKASGQWDVAYPSEEYGDQVAYTRRAVAKMTVQDLQRHLDQEAIRYKNALTFEIRKALFNNTQDSFVDEDHGTLLIEPLANGDTVVYPPVLGSETEATEDHYLASGYVATAISDTNNPYETIVEDLVHHFGDDSGGSNIAVMIHPDETPETMDLTDFVDVPDNFIMSGDNADIPMRLPSVPGKIIGRMTGLSACWVSQWRWMPTGYMLAIHLEEPAPLIQRAPPAAWGLPSGLQLVAENDRYPFHQAHYEVNFGLGCGNRLNGVLMELTAGAFSIPTGYS